MKDQRVRFHSASGTSLALISNAVVKWAEPFDGGRIVSFSRSLSSSKPSRTSEWHHRLKPSAAPAEEQEENHDQQDEAEAAAAVIAKAGAHVVTAAAEQ